MLTISGIASVSHRSLIILSEPKHEAKFFSKSFSFSLLFSPIFFIICPKNFSQCFSILRRRDPPPTSKKLIPEFKLNSGTIICFFIVSKISSNLAFITFKIKFLLIFLKLELIK